MGMSLPMAVLSLFTWLKNPYKGKKSQVTVNHIKKKEVAFLMLLSLVVTFSFYFILKHFNTANLSLSTLSILTSFIAAYLTFRRSPFFALAYAINDIVLIAMWILASIKNLGYVSVIICFLIFLVNDSYTFVSWLRLQKKQAE
jgi:nicotinamide mononucleotide transporter PnuC